MRSNSSADRSGSPTSRSRSRRARRRRSRSSSKESSSIRRCWPTSARRRRPCTSTSSASGPAWSAGAFAEALIAKAAEGVPVRLVVDRQGTDPDRASRDFYDRLLAAGIEVGVVRATQPRAPRGLLGAGGAVRWNRASSGTSTTASSSSSTGASAGSAERASRTTSRTAASTTLSPRDGAGRLPAPARLPRQLPLARRRDPGRRGRRALPGARPGRTGSRPSCSTTRRAGSGRSRRRSRGCWTRARDAGRRQSLRHRPRDDPADRARRAARGARAAVRARRGEQLGLRRRAAVPPQGAARCRRAHPRVSDDAAREGVRAGRRGGARRHVQPRGLEPEAVLRDRRARAFARAGGAVRGAVLGPRRGRVAPGRVAHRASGRAARQQPSPRSHPCSSSRVSPGWRIRTSTSVTSRANS